MNFWNNLRKPFFCLAPMEDVTDSVSRQIVISCGRPDVCFTEFTNVDAIEHRGGLERLVYTEVERPIVAQIWGTDPAKFASAAEYIKELGFDGIDINMGCPVRDVVKIGACSAMIGKNVQVAEIIAATREAGLPVSVKTRVGINKIITEDWIGFLLEQNLAAITIHGRTAKEMSKVPAHWDEIGKAAKLQRKTLIIGNGDVQDLDDAKEKVERYGVDGVMIGRAAINNPWIFSGRNGTKEERINLLKKHYELEKGERFKKFVKAYINGFDGARELRSELMDDLTKIDTF